jgi:hypothetical protein
LPKSAGNTNHNEVAPLAREENVGGDALAAIHLSHADDTLPTTLALQAPGVLLLVKPYSGQV